MRTPGSNRTVDINSPITLGVDRVYLLLIGAHHKFMWLPVLENVESFNKELSKHPTRPVSCANEEGYHWHGVTKANYKDLDHFLLWDFSYENREMETIVTQCINNEYLAKPVGHVFFHPHTESPSIAPVAMMPSMSPVVYATENTTVRDESDPVPPAP